LVKGTTMEEEISLIDSIRGKTLSSLSYYLKKRNEGKDIKEGTKIETEREQSLFLSDDNKVISLLETLPSSVRKLHSTLNSKEER